jgi:hypothetical protein
MSTTTAIDGNDDYLTALADTWDACGFARDRLLFDPDVHQEAVLECDARRVILNCSRQWGKSTVVAAKAVHAAWTKSGALVIVASPTLKQSGEFIRKAKAFLANLGIHAKGDGTNRVSVLLPNGSRIVGISDVHATSRGLSGASMLIFDEAAQVSDELYKAMRATLATSRGALWLLSTPYGKRGFFYHEWANGENWTRFKVQATDCPASRPTTSNSERRDLGPDYFQQEYMGHFFAPWTPSSTKPPAAGP